jgi:hypothetical protein
MNEKRVVGIALFFLLFFCGQIPSLDHKKQGKKKRKMGEKDSLGMRLSQKVFVVGLAYQGNDIVFRFIIEYYSSLNDIVFRFIIEYIVAYMILCLDSL